MNTLTPMAIMALFILTGGCVSPVWFVPVNYPGETYQRIFLEEKSGARFYAEDGLADARWMEIERGDGSGFVGGYLSTNMEHRGAIIVMLDGATVWLSENSEGGAKYWHTHDAVLYRSYGFMTFSPALPECATAYGERDLADLIEAVDWLDRQGRSLWNIERIYVLGYSKGATLAALLNRSRQVTALVGLGGLYEPDQLRNLFGIYSVLASLAPDNEGLCQLGATLDYYASPESGGWDTLDVVGHLEELHSPMLFIHGTADLVWSVRNTRHVEERYTRLRADGVELPPLEFMYLKNGSHKDVRNTPEARNRVLAYLEQFEPVPLTELSEANPGN